MSKKINDLGYKTNKVIKSINDYELFMNLENSKNNMKKKKLNREYYKEEEWKFDTANLVKFFEKINKS